MLREAGLSEQRGGRLLSAVVTVRGEDSGDRVIEAFRHAVGLRGSRFGQAAFDAERRARLVGLMLAGCLVILGTEQAIGERLAIPRQRLADLNQAGIVEGAQKGTGGSDRPVGLDGDIDPSLCAVDGREETALGRHVSPPRRLFDGRVQLAFHAVAALPAPIGVYGDRQFDRKRRPPTGARTGCRPVGPAWSGRPYASGYSYRFVREFVTQAAHHCPADNMSDSA